MKYLKKISESLSIEELEDYLLDLSDSGFEVKFWKKHQTKPYRIRREWIKDENKIIEIISPTIKINKARGIITNTKIIEDNISYVESKVSRFFNRIKDNYKYCEADLYLGKRYLDIVMEEEKVSNIYVRENKTISKKDSKIIPEKVSNLLNLTPQEDFRIIVDCVLIS